MGVRCHSWHWQHSDQALTGSWCLIPRTFPGWGHQASSNAERNSGLGLFLASATPPGRLRTWQIRLPLSDLLISSFLSPWALCDVGSLTPSHCPSPCWLRSQGSSLYLNGQLKFLFKNSHTHGSSLAVQWLEPSTFTAVAWVQSLAEKLRSCKLCMWCSWAGWEI